MILLILGVLLWSGVHGLPIFARGLRAGIVERTGEDPYKGLFSLGIVLSIVLMVLGWRSLSPSFLYTPPASPLVTNVLVFLAFVLFVASAVPTNLKRVLRHPQLTGLALWAVSHLLANGDSRSLVLFGGLGLWAVVAMLGINRRDGAWQKPEAQPLSAELKVLIGAIVFFAVLFFAHPYIAGVSPLPR